jgi:putative FmdB family regulatory protein
MPLYVYKCDACQGVGNVFKKLAELNRAEACPWCESLIPMQRQVTKANVVADYAAYDCPITGKRIEGRRQHEENLKLHGCRVYEPGETDLLKRRRADDEADLDRRLGETVDEWIAQAPAEKREALAQAETMGIDAQVITKSVPSSIATPIAP